MFDYNKRKIVLPILIIIMLAIFFIDNKYIFCRVLQENRYASENVRFANKQEENVFKISKIIKYSSAEAIDNTAEQNLQDVSISQYSDIAIYIDNGSGELNEKNTIKELYIDDFKVDVGYKYGTPELYYKNPLDISKYRLIEDNKIEEKLNYKVVYTNEQNENSNYEKPVFFTDCSNPITFEFINKNIINNYQVTKENGLVAFDGRMLENLDVDLDELSPKISFTIHIKNNLDESFICKASANLKLKTDEGNIKSGYIIEILDDIKYYNFFKE